MPRILPLQPAPSPEVLGAVNRVFRASGVIAVPTESFYALAASAWDPVAVQRLCAIKGRPPGKPILVLIGDRAPLAPLVAEIPPAAGVLMDRFWPGPLTLVFAASRKLPESLTAGTGSVGIRHVALPVLSAVLREIGPVTGTSANRSGDAPARTAQEVRAALGDWVDLILDSGPTPEALPSTIVDTRDPVRLLREGPIGRDQIAEAVRAAGFPFHS